MKKNITKRLVLLSTVLVAFGSGHAWADHHGGDHKGQKFEKHDLNGDGVISKDEFLNHAQDRFSKIDADGSGDVSKEEAKAHHKARRAEFKERRAKRKEAAE